MTGYPRNPSAKSQCGRVLAVLADGQPHSLQEIHAHAGPMRLNSRIAELRRPYGRDIRCWRDRDTYWYQLVEVSSPGAAPVSEPPAGVASPPTAAFA